MSSTHFTASLEITRLRNLQGKMPRDPSKGLGWGPLTDKLIFFSRTCAIKLLVIFFFYWKFKTEGKLLMLVSQTIISGFTSAPYILEKQFEKTKLAPSTSIFLTTNVMNLLQNDLITFLNFQNVKKIEITEFIFRGINSLLNSFFFCSKQLYSKYCLVYYHAFIYCCLFTINRERK